MALYHGATPDYYAVLRVSRYSSGEDIKKAYHRMAKLYHPDVNKDDVTAVERFKAVNEAYAVLSDPSERRSYDACNRWAGAGIGYDGGAGMDDGDARVTAWAASMPRRAHVRPDVPGSGNGAGGRGRGQSSAEARADPLDRDAWVRGHAASAAAGPAGGLGGFATGADGGDVTGRGFTPFDGKRMGRVDGWEARRAARAAGRGVVADVDGASYRAWATRFREAQRASERWWPIMAVGWVAGLTALYLVTRKGSGR